MSAPAPIVVTAATARSILLGSQLRFGDELLIRCVDLLCEIERVRDIIRQCPHGPHEICATCHGTGTMTCPECGSEDVECSECGGEEFEACECIEGVSAAILTEVYRLEHPDLYRRKRTTAPEQMLTDPEAINSSLKG